MNTFFSTPSGDLWCNLCSLIADAEVMYVVSEIIADLPGLQEHQFSVLINHTSLLSSILTHCSIPEEKHSEALPLLYKMVVSINVSM